MSEEFYLGGIGPTGEGVLCGLGLDKKGRCF